MSAVYKKIATSQRCAVVALCDSVAVEPLPYLTATILGVGGQLRTIDDDFIVNETPAYLPTGIGDHVMIRVQKRGITTPQAAAGLARALNVAERDVGWAGMKDRRAVTTQWLSVPPPVSPEQIALLAANPPMTSDGGELRIIEWARHPHKLRTGHVASNEFQLRIRALDATVTPLTALHRAQQIVAALAQGPGALNWYGEQRFGRDGDNAARGLALLLGTQALARHPRGQKLDRFLLSALQSHLFNQWLQRRLEDGLINRALLGDVMRKRSGGMFVCESPDIDQARVDAGEIVATGPMFGIEMRRAPDGTLAREREDAILAAQGLQLGQFAAVKRLAAGTRRDLAIAVQQSKISAIDDDLQVEFALDAGGYATAIMRELMKVTPLDAPRAEPSAAMQHDSKLQSPNADLDFAESVKQ